MKLEDKVVMVTGGEGFIGSHLVERLAKENPKEIRVAFIRDIDLSNPPEVRQMFSGNTKPDVVFNLAVVGLMSSLQDPAWVVRTNVNMTLNLCEAQRMGCFNTLIQFSSSEAYGTAISCPMKEDHPVNPTTPYGASKLATDYIALSYQNTFGLDTSVIRPFNVYGPGKNSGLIPKTIKGVLGGGRIYVNGSGEQTRDLTYVTDTVEAAVRICENEATRGKIINIGSGRDLSINYIVETIAKELEYSGPIIHREERLGEVKRLVADIGLAKSLIGYAPSVSFEEGIKQTIEWYKK
jgi:UDP-glucose 4-epimerase